MIIFMNVRIRTSDIRRLSRILTIAIKHGFGFVIAELGLERFLPRTYRKIERYLGARNELPQHFRLMLEELGPTFIKIGQILSVRPDILPLEYIEELEKLQDTVPPFSAEVARSIFEEETGKTVGEVFEAFEDKPVASASLAQVHRATIKGGEKVAVKIQRPDAEETIENDLRLMRIVAELTRERVKQVDTIGLWEEFASSLRNELNFTYEGKNIEEFRKNFADDPYIYIPKVYWEYSSKKVLTMEYVEGWSLKEVNKAIAAGVDTRFLAEYGAKAFMKQVLEHGIFHADLHPANILITPDGKIAYLDFGMVGRIEADAKRAMALMLMAQIKKDAEEIVRQAEALGIHIPRAKVPAMREELKSIIDRYYGKKIGELSIDIIGKEFVSLLYKNQVRIPKDYALLIKALITIEGVGKTLYPDINVLEVAKPYVRSLVAEYYTKGDFLSDILGDLKDNLLIAINLPKKIDNLLMMAEGISEQRAEQTKSIEELTKTVRESTLILSTILLGGFMIAGLALVIITASTGSILKIIISLCVFIAASLFLVMVLMRYLFRR